MRYRPGDRVRVTSLDGTTVIATIIAVRAFGSMDLLTVENDLGGCPRIDDREGGRGLDTQGKTVPGIGHRELPSTGDPARDRVLIDAASAAWDAYHKSRREGWDRLTEERHGGKAMPPGGAKQRSRPPRTQAALLKIVHIYQILIGETEHDETVPDPDLPEEFDAIGLPLRREDALRRLAIHLGLTERTVWELLHKHGPRLLGGPLDLPPRPRK
ncbi:MAG TPA: hypothetical protein DEP35_10565 [Deltaproteobacteria bacterium]|jgi:hypothetical protein|nr:hypothetical protein [Deltaproteobacteria bacterium]